MPEHVPLTLLVYPTPHRNAILYTDLYGTLELGKAKYGKVGGEKDGR